MITVTVTAGQTIPLGHQYDNEATMVVFPSDIIEAITNEFGTTGTFYIWYRRPGDALGYPIGSPLVVYETNKVKWLVTEAEVATPGSGQVQLRYVVSDVVVMSAVWSAVVTDSVDIGDDVPEPMESWADAIVAAAESITSAVPITDAEIDAIIGTLS